MILTNILITFFFSKSAIYYLCFGFSLFRCYHCRMINKVVYYTVLFKKYPYPLKLFSAFLLMAGP